MKTNTLLLPIALLLASAVALPSLSPANGPGHGGSGPAGGGHGGSGPAGGGHGGSGPAGGGHGGSGPGGSGGGPAGSGGSGGGGAGGGSGGAGGVVGRYTACSGLYSSPQCCATDVLGVADLDCANRRSPMHFIETASALVCRSPSPLPSPPYYRAPCALHADSQFVAPSVPSSASAFSAVCAAGGQRARCCVLPVVSPCSPA